MQRTPERQPSSMALFMDFENIALGVQDQKVQFDITLVLERLLEKGNILVKRAYSDWERFRDYKRSLHEAAVELIEVPHRRLAGKNSADIRLVVDVLDLSYNKPHLDTFVIASGDSDFSPLVAKLRENDKYVIGIGVRGSTSELLVGGCDEFIYYDDIAREAQRANERLPKRLDDLPAERAAAFSLLIRVARGLMREDRDVLWGSMVKQTMKRKQPSFDESVVGFSSFSRFLEGARDLGLLKLRRDERSGGYIIDAIAEDLL